MRTRRRDNFVFDPSLVLYLPLWKRDGLTFPSDDAYGHLATVTGALWTSQGRTFDGTDDKITLPDASSLRITGQITIEAWIKSTFPAGNTVIVTKKAEADTTGYRFFVDGDSRNARFEWANVAVANIAYDGYVMPLSQEHHIAIVAVDATERIYWYHNGLLTSTETGKTITLSVGTQNLIIGSSDGTYFWKNLIGEVRLYNRALSPLEIQRNYLATKWRYS